jgi:hypothetical protein
MQNLKLYQARLQCRTVGLMAFDLEDARLCLQELYPNESVLSLILAPEWCLEPDDIT